MTCYVCGASGHLCCAPMDAAAKSWDLGSRTRSCCRCGGTGHVDSECAQGRRGGLAEHDGGGAAARALGKARMPPLELQPCAAAPKLALDGGALFVFDECAPAGETLVDIELTASDALPKRLVALGAAAEPVACSV